MSASVDVVSIMDRDAQHAAAYRLAHGYADGPLSEPVREAADARAAVAELIAADQEYDDAAERHANAAIYCDHFDPEKGYAGRALEAARVRRAAALARMQGDQS